MLDFYWGNCFLIIYFQFILMVSQTAVFPPPPPLRMLSSINNFYKYLGQTLLAVIPTLPLMIIRSILRVKHHYLASIFKGWGSYYLYRIKLTNSNYLLSYYPQWSWKRSHHQTCEWHWCASHVCTLSVKYNCLVGILAVYNTPIPGSPLLWVFLPASAEGEILAFHPFAYRKPLLFLCI